MFTGVNVKSHTRYKKNLLIQLVLQSELSMLFLIILSCQVLPGNKTFNVQPFYKIKFNFLSENMNSLTKSTLCDETDETDDQHMVKRLKVDFDDQKRIELKSDMTILNVIDDCLVDIFMHLSLSDLLNVRATNSRFQIPTERAFVRKHRNNSVIVSNVDTDCTNCVDGHMLKYSINILQQFGHCITKLCIKFKLENIGRLLEAVVAYSGDSIIKLKYCHLMEEWYMGLHRTGLRRIKRQLLGLKTKFPNLLHLKFEYNDLVGCPYSDEIIQAIPTITSFNATGVIFSHEDVSRFIGLNCQLENLQLWVPNGFITQSFINNLDASLPKLKSLKMNRLTIEGNLDPIDPNRFICLRKLTYGTVSTHISVNGLPSLFGEEIQELELYCSQYIISNFVESVSRFRKLTQLILYWPPNVHPPSLLTFDMSVVSPIAIQDLILRNNQLTKIEVAWHYPLMHFKHFENKYKTFRDKLKASQWYVNISQWIEAANTRLIGISVTFSKGKEMYRPMY